MKIKSIILSTAIAGVGIASAAIAQDGPPNGVPYTSVPAIPVKKCLNMGNMFEQPKDLSWNGRLPTEKDYQEIAALGFDSVRLPVRWSAYADKNAPYTIDPKFFATIDANVAYATKHGLNIIINVHHYDDIFDDPEGHSDRFVGLWQQIAKHYQNQPKSALLRLKPLIRPKMIKILSRLSIFTNRLISAIKGPAGSTHHRLLPQALAATKIIVG
jgi:endoglucanase